MKTTLLILTALLIALQSDAQTKVVYKSYTYIGTATTGIVKTVTADWQQHIKTIDSLKLALSSRKELDSLKKVVAVYKALQKDNLQASLDNYFQVVTNNTPRGAIFSSRTTKKDNGTEPPLGFFLRYKDGDSIYSVRVLQFDK
jgi:hypothetical protein